MKVATICSVYGSYDSLKELPEQTVPFEQILVSEIHDGSNRGVFVEPRPHCHPRLAAKHAKCLPFEYTDADVVVWVDGSIQVTSADWLDFLIKESAGSPISQYPHPQRDDILDEADASLPMTKYSGHRLHAQAHHYLSLGHPRNWGLWSTGVIVYRKDAIGSNTLDAFGKTWLTEQVRWTYQDQISEPYVLRTLGLRPRTINDNLYDSPFLTLHAHPREDQ